MIDVPSRPRIYVDSNIFIQAFEGAAASKPDILRLFSLIHRWPGLASTSEFTLAEVLGRNGDFRDWNTQKAFYLGLLTRKSFIALVPLSFDLLEQASDLRQEMRLKARSLRLPDAIHIASARAMGCELFLSDDRRIAGCLPSSLRLVAPDAMSDLIQTLDA